MVHYYNYENGIQDCSRGNTYHNKRFKREAENRGLLITHSDKYGWSHTEPTEELLDFVIENGLTDILINRNDGMGFFTGRPPLTKDDIPQVFYRHYPAYKNKQLNVSELARVCDMSRTTVYKYIEVIER